MMNPPLHYILWDEGPIKLLGFNRYKTPGYSDCGAGWDDEQREEFEEKVLNELSPWISTFEFTEFTYEIMKEDGLEAKLAEMGIGKQDPEWFWDGIQ